MKPSRSLGLLAAALALGLGVFVSTRYPATDAGPTTTAEAGTSSAAQVPPAIAASGSPSRTSPAQTGMPNARPDPTTAADAGAEAYARYRDITRCARAEQALAVVQSELKSGKITAAQAESLLAHPDLQSTNCTGVRDDGRTPYEWLDLAAAAGVRDAQLEFFYAGSPILDRPELAVQKPELAIAYRTKAMTYLGDAALHCDTRALMLLSDIYTDGTLATPDPVRAAGYAYVLSIAKPKSYTGISEQRLGVLTDEQRALAKRFGGDFWQKYCR